MMFSGCSGKAVRDAALAITSLLLLAGSPRASGANLTVAWDPGTDPAVVGYKFYYGGSSRSYTNVQDMRAATQVTLPGLVPGNTYYFAATTYNTLGLESAYSTEAAYTVPVNAAPTLDQPANVTAIENAAPITVTLTGISSGSPSEAQTLTVTATSSNPGLIPTPAVAYASPNPTAQLTLTPLAMSFGSATISVLVDDGGAANNSVIKTFTVSVLPVNNPPTLDPISNVTMNEGTSQNVSLTGISTGATNEFDTLTVTAVSSRPDILPNPLVSYTSASATGSLTLVPAPFAFGTAVVTVNVNDGAASNNFVARSFTVVVNPVNNPPTLNPIADLALGTNTSQQTVNLTGISSGASNEFQTLVVTANSSNPSLVPNPTVTYTSPNATGTLKFTPSVNGAGTATISVTVNDSAPSNNIVTRTFNVAVSQSTAALQTVTNYLLPDVAGRVTVPAPNADHLSYNLDPGAPSWVKVLNKNILSCRPTRANALTTNLVNVRITDQDVPSLSTVQPVVIIVSDFLEVSVGSTNVYAGQPAGVPLGVASSGGVTNLTFSLPWPTNRFSSPSISSAAPAIGSSSVQVQNTNLLITLRAAPGQLLQSTNFAALLNFQTLPGQSSAFVIFQPTNIVGKAGSGGSYANTIARLSQSVIVNGTPLLQATVSTNSVRCLTSYGRAGTNYVLQYSTDLLGKTWNNVASYSQTNIAQPVALGSTPSAIFYRLKQ
jgi:hypothetical protein